MKQYLRRALNTLGLGIIRSERLRQFEDMEAQNREIFELVATSHGLGENVKSQLGQDILVLLETGFKRDGFFVEFGATDGICHSNTYLLEKRYGWKGILAEPARTWQEALARNRTALIDFDCVWTMSGSRLPFNMTEDATLSTILHLSESDYHSAERKNGETYEVTTVSLLDLLRRHNAPHNIDYLSIDTEGSEFAILDRFDFDAYNISVITCEHNYTRDRQKIFELLTSKGYERKFSGLSRWDDWYVRKDYVVPPAIRSTESNECP